MLRASVNIRFWTTELRLQQKTEFNIPTSSAVQDSIHGQMSQYLAKLCSRTPMSLSDQALLFWQQRRAVFTKLPPVAEDLIAAPASEAYVERSFYQQQCAQCKPPIFNLLRGRFWGFLPCKGDKLHRWGWNLAWRTPRTEIFTHIWPICGI